MIVGALTDLSMTAVGGLLLAAVAAVMDWRWRRVPNWFSYPTVVTGGVAASLSWPPHGIGVVCWIGVLLASLVLFRAGRLGGGDLKMLAGLGLWIPHPEWINAMIWSLAMGGVVSLVLLVRRLGMLGAAAWLDIVRRQLAAGDMAAMSDGTRLPLLVFVALGIAIEVAAPHWPLIS